MKRTLVFLAMFVAILSHAEETSDRPFWTEKANYVEGDRVYFVGVASDAPSPEEGRRRAARSAQDEMKMFLQLDSVKDLGLKSQMTFEEETSVGVNVFRLMWIDKPELKSFLKKAVSRSHLSSESEKMIGQLITKIDRIDEKMKETELNKQLILNGQFINPRALDNFAYRGNTRLVAFLIEQGVDVNGSDLQFCAPLLIAVQGGQLETVRLLLSKGARTDEPPTRGGRPRCPKTPLTTAAQNGDVAIVKALLDYCADPSKPNERGETAQQLTRDNGIKKLLQGKPGRCRRPSSKKG